MNIVAKKTTTALEPYTACHARVFSPMFPGIERGTKVIVKGLVYTPQMSDIEVNGWSNYLIVQLYQDGKEYAVKAEDFKNGTNVLNFFKELEYKQRMDKFLASAHRLGRTRLEIESDINVALIAKR